MTDFCERSLSRRAVLRGIAATGVGAALGAFFAADAQRGKRRIDTHHHFCPPELKLALADYYKNMGVNNWTVENTLNWTVAKTLDDMDKGGVTSAVLSMPAIPANWFGGDPATARFSRICNDYAAGLVRDHPGRASAYGRRFRCSTWMRVSRRSSTRSTNSRPTASASLPPTATSGLAIPSSSRSLRSSTGGRQQSLSIR